jgi:tRNA dimethylallyltransferase
VQKTLIIIGGATASGKTSLALEIANFLETEIISADSRQCFKELNIGVAKPNSHDLQLVKHHNINSYSITESPEVATFESNSMKELERIYKTNDFAVCVGGTGLYIKALCDGIDAMPPIDASIKEQIENAYLMNGLGWLIDQIELHDPKFLNKFPQKNPARILRALIFKLSTNISILEFQKNSSVKRDFNILYYCIKMDRNKLYDRINMRLDSMIEDGLVEEVKALYPFRNLPSLRTIGYSELFDYLNEKITLIEAIEKIKQHSRNYAKRQLTWFRNDGRFQFLEKENIISEIKLIANKK